MCAQVHDEFHANLSSLRAKTWNDRFHEIKGEISKKILSIAYGFGLGYTTLAESYEVHNSNLFREIIIEAQTTQRGDDSQIFHTIAKGNLYEVEMLLNRIEQMIRVEVTEDMKGALKSEIASVIDKRIKASEIYSHDVAGANIVHLAYLFKHYHIGHYLVKRYPRLASLPYVKDIENLTNYVELVARRNPKSNLSAKLDNLRKRLNVQSDSEMEENMLYTGENILHMTIMRRNYEETRWLLDFYRDHRHSFPDCLGRLLNTDATGKFFDRKGSFYVGSNPLQFAVCSNSTAIFDLVYSFVSALEDSGEPLDDTHTVTACSHFVGPDVIFATDQFGNNVLHLCVLHGLANMYEHVHNTALQVMKRKLQTLYIEHAAQAQIGPTSPRAGNSEKVHDSSNPRVFTLGCNLDGMSNYMGFRLHEKVLHLPENAASVKGWISAEGRRKVDERLVLALNNDLHSPLTLAAFIINKKEDNEEQMKQKVEMLRFLVNKTRIKLWEYGPVTMSVLNLDGIEVKYDVLQHYDCTGREQEVAKQKQRQKVHSAICWLCINDSDKAIQIPEIEKLIQAKWERVGYPFFVLSFLINTFLTVCVTLILVFINATPTDNTSYPTEIIVNILYLIVALAFLIMFLQEVHDLIVFGRLTKNFRGVAFFDKMMRVVKVLSFVTFCCCKTRAAWRYQVDEENSYGGATVLYNIHDDQGIKVSLVVCVIASYLHLYYFFMGFDSTGPFVLTMFRIVTNDVPYFMNFFLIVVVAFAAALSCLSNNRSPEAGYGFAHLIKAIWTLIQDTVGVDATHDQINSVLDYPQHLQWMAEILLTAYYVSVVIIMLNLLIAMISDTYAAYTEYNEAILLIAKYNIMNAMEWVMWPAELLENRSKYAQIDEQTKVKRVKAEESVRTKPAMSVVRTSSKSFRPNWKKANSYNTMQIEERVQVKYLFELQTVNHSWYENDGAGASIAGATGGDSENSKKIAEAVAAALGHPSLNDNSSNRTATNRKTTLFIIDPQVDFHPGGTLAIPNAAADSERIVEMIDSFGDEHIHDIFVSMDSHYPCHIAHAVSWHKKDQPDVHPEPLVTKITNADVLNENWVYADKRPEMQEWARGYTGALERRGRMVLTIWPEHCIIGSTGHSVVPNINAALQRWAERSGRPVNYVMKGQNLRVEMYSALQAEVPDPLDQNTGLNTELLSLLKTSDRLLICGQAMSHCVNFTTRDIIENWDKKMSSIVLLTDGSSPVPTFEVEAEEFKRHCTARGVTLNTIKEAFSDCKAKPANA